MGWRENGEWLAFPGRMARAQNLDDPRHKLFASCKEYVRTGDPTKIAGYLHSANSTGPKDEEITRYERAMVAQALEQRQRNL